MEAHDHHCHNGECHETDEPRWTKGKTEFAQIQTQVSGPGTIQNFVQVSGKVIFHPDHLAYVLPKVSGTVVEVRKNLGESVGEGEVLALIESRELAEARAAHLVASKKYIYSKALLNQELKLEGISAEQELQNAKLAAALAEIEVRLAAQKLYALGFSREEIVSTAPQNSSEYRIFSVKAPLKGKVLQRDLTLGEWVDSSRQIFTVGNLDKVWVEITISSSDVLYLKEGLPIEITAVHGKLATAQIKQFLPTISEETRMATAIALIENHQGEWMPGQFVTAQIQTDSMESAIVVPQAAIQMIKGEQCVFIENGEEFIPCVVKLGKMDRENVEVLSGLDPGVSYAASNTFCLKADFEKEDAEHHHH